MIKKEDLETARELLRADKPQQAIALLDALLEDGQDENKDEAYYLRGNAYRRSENWREAINNYTRAVELNPSSPALAMRSSCIEILNFFNKDMFNH